MMAYEQSRIRFYRSQRIVIAIIEVRSREEDYININPDPGGRQPFRLDKISAALVSLLSAARDKQRHPDWIGPLVP